MKSFILIFLSILIIGCSSSHKPTNPVPKIGATFSMSDYDIVEFVEATSDWHKYRVEKTSGLVIGVDFTYYVVCDPNEKIISIWKPEH